MPAAERMPIAARRRVAIVAADAGRLLRLRTPLIKAITARGHKLLCVTGWAGMADAAGLAELGLETAAFPLGREHLGALSDRPAIAALRATLADWKPSVVLGFGLKPMVMAARAARRIDGVRIVLVLPSLTGLSAGRDRPPGLATRWMVRRGLKAAHALVVHNLEHEAALRKLDLVPAQLTTRLLAGAGVDLAHYAPQPLPDTANGLTFTMITRSEPQKGVTEFCEAARRVKAKAPHTRFVLATWLRRGDERGGEAGLQKYADAVELMPAPADVRGLLAASHVFVLPSHTEGMAHEVAEALACGRPAIASNIAGCRELVDERVSGVLVPPGDAAALAAAMESFVRRPGDLGWMSQASRRKAERRFDAQPIALDMLEVMELVARM